MKYKVGDKVRVKSLEWYNENKNEFGEVDVPNNIFTSDMSKFCGSIVTIQDIDLDVYVVKENECYWTDDMLEGLAEEEIDDKDDIDPLHELCQSKLSAVIIESDIFKDEVELILNGYEIEIRDGKTYAIKKKPQYPKTFIEVLNFWHPDRQIEDDYQKYYKKDLIEKFQNLLYARDAYWKIAGEEMGLGKSWEPYYVSLVNNEYFTIHTFNNEIIKSSTSHRNAILAFPTEEMRDAFYENFKDLIEKCKNFI
jgi:hypothetical protein